MSEKINSNGLVLVITTESDWDKAKALASTLLERKVVACASLHEVNSHYWWKGKLVEGKEVQLLLKTTNDLLENLWESTVELHSYENPEWIYWSADSEGKYKSWLLNSVCSR